MNKPSVLVNGEVELRPLSMLHAETSYKWRNIPEIWEYTLSKPNKKVSIEDERNWMAQKLKEEDSKRFAIYFKKEYTGNIYLTGIANGGADYHIFIGEQKHWGKGVARKASRLIIDYGRGVLNLKTIFLEVDPRNGGAIRLYESLGFNDVGQTPKGHRKMELNLDIYADMVK